jgi:hypothetical protein
MVSAYPSIPMSSAASASTSMPAAPFYALTTLFAGALFSGSLLSAGSSVSVDLSMASAAASNSTSAAAVAVPTAPNTLPPAPILPAALRPPLLWRLPRPRLTWRPPRRSSRHLRLPQLLYLCTMAAPHHWPMVCPRRSMACPRRSIAHLRRLMARSRPAMARPS